MEFARRHLLQSCGVKAVVDTAKRGVQAPSVPYVTEIELELWTAELLPHVVLLLLVPAEDPDLANVRLEKSLENGVTKRAGAAGDQEYAFQAVVLESLHTHVHRYTHAALVDCSARATRMSSSRWLCVG